MFAIVDCNNFYVSCERVFKPELNGKPVVVLSNNDGCIISRSQEAKDLGIKMGDPAFLMEDIFRKNGVIVYSSNYTLYGDLSERVMNTLRTLAPDIEIYSIDEAFLDLSNMKIDNLNDFASNIKETVYRWTAIPVSVGLAPTKTLAKVANHIAKKNKDYKGVCLMMDKEVRERILAAYPVEELWGVGRQYARLLRKKKINTALELLRMNDGWIKKNMTIQGLRMADELRGISCIDIETDTEPKKNICTSRSFGAMTSDLEVLNEAVSNYAASCALKLRKQSSVANLLCIFLETNRFRLQDKQYNNYKALKLPVATSDTAELIHYALLGLKLIYKKGFNYKKAGVIVSGIVPSMPLQQELFDIKDRVSSEKILKVIDKLNDKMGRDVVRSASQGFVRKWKLRQERLSPCYTTRWTEIPIIKL